MRPGVTEAPWLIRVASRPEAGAGHVSRCRALASALSGYAPVVMALDRGGEAWLPKLAADNLTADNLTAVIEDEEPQGSFAGSVLDGYGFTPDYATALARRAPPLVVLDDFLDPPPCADLVVNGAPHLDGQEIKGIPALLGPRYALLDTCFQDLVPKAASDSVEHIVVTFGMRDSANATCLALKALRLLEAQDIRPRITVALGGNASHFEAVREAVVRLGGRASLRVDEADMLALLRSADLVIGAGGVSLLERMACGVPSITIASAENQRLAIAGAVRLGGTMDRGSVADVTPRSLTSKLAELIGNHEARAVMTVQGPRIVDGKGTERVAKAMVALAQRRHHMVEKMSLAGRTS